MEWINNFSKTQIPYYLYKLNTYDSILHFSKSLQNQHIIILEGTVGIFRVFNNKKTFFIGILNKNHILNLETINKSLDSCYKMIALNTTYVISFSVSIKSCTNPKIFFNIIKAQTLTTKRYEIINCILKQQYYKYKIIQMILFLFLEFGTIKNRQVKLAFQLSRKELALISGVNKNQISQVVNLLISQKIIKLSSHKTIHLYNIYRLFFLYCY